MKAYEWLSIDIPLNTLSSSANIAQLAISGSVSSIYVDNIFFHGSEISTEPSALSEPILPPEPTTADPSAQHASSNVISLSSDVYTNVFVDTWSTDWDVADVADVTIQGNATKLYTNTVFCGIEMVSNPVNAEKMTYVHMDIWTPNPTAAASFNIKLVDFGQDGGYGGGDDTEGEVSITASTTPALKTGEWVSIDIPLSDFERMGLKGVSNLAQIVISGDLNTFYLDNVYFYSK